MSHEIFEYRHSCRKFAAVFLSAYGSTKRSFGTRKDSVNNRNEFGNGFFDSSFVLDRNSKTKCTFSNLFIGLILVEQQFSVIMSTRSLDRCL